MKPKFLELIIVIAGLTAGALPGSPAQKSGNILRVRARPRSFSMMRKFFPSSKTSENK